MRLYLIRHAESANNAIYSGTGEETGRVPDPDITEKGQAQTERLAHLLADDAAEKVQLPRSGRSGFQFTHLYCSLMTRTMMTGTPVARKLGLPLIALENTFENGGIYEVQEDGKPLGLPGPGRSYFTNRFPHIRLPDSVDETGWYNRPYETNAMFIKRMKQVVPETLVRHGGTQDTVGLIAHGDFIDQFINELMGVRRLPANYEGYWEANWAFNNTAVSRIDFEGGSPTIVYLNRIDHLPAELITW